MAGCICAVIVIVWLVMIVCGCIASDITEHKTDKTTYVSSTYGLQSLVNKNGAETKTSGGAFFFLGIGGGTIESKTENNQYYYTIVDYPNKGCKIEKYGIEDTYIKEELNLKQPYIEWNVDINE